jgi:transcription-repair coupling factor (superfamily II helicase)
MDLEIRGAGNLLGGEQSGHIAAVGFEMYCQLLERAVQELKGEAPAPETKVQINLGVDIRIPEEYIGDFGERLVLYKEIASASDEAHLERISDRVRDLYGALPPQADRLLALARLRIQADALRARAIDLSRGGIEVRFGTDSPVDPQALVRLVGSRRGLSLLPKGLLRLDLPPSAGDLERIESVRDLLRAIRPCDSLPPSPGSSIAER